MLGYKSLAAIMAVIRLAISLRSLPPTSAEGLCLSSVSHAFLTKGLECSGAWQNFPASRIIAEKHGGIIPRIRCCLYRDGCFIANRQAHAWKAKGARLGMQRRIDRRKLQIKLRTQPAKNAQVFEVDQNAVAPWNKGREEPAKERSQSAAVPGSNCS